MLKANGQSRDSQEQSCSSWCQLMNSHQDFNQIQSKTNLNKISVPLKFNVKNFKQNEKIKDLFKSRSKIINGTNKITNLNANSMFQPFNDKERRQDNQNLHSLNKRLLQECVTKSRKITIEENISYQNSFKRPPMNFQHINQFPSQFEQLWQIESKFDESLENQKYDVHKQDDCKKQGWQLGSTAPSEIGFIKKGLSLKFDVLQQNSDPSIPSHKVIMKKQLTNTDSPTSELKTMKTLKSWKSMNTTKTILTNEGTHHFEATRVQKISQSLWSTVCKIKPHDCEGYIIRKKVMKVEQAKSQQLQLLSSSSGHPFIVCLFDAYQVSQTNGYFIEMLMEYYPDGDLKRKIYLEGALQLRRVKLYAYQLFRGLHFLHTQKICHRDIRSQNIFMRGDKLVIGDLSQAILLKDSDLLPFCLSEHEGRAPELVFDNCSAYNEKIDMWAAGCLIMEMVLGHTLFSSNCSNEDLFIQIIKLRGFPTQHDMQALSSNYRSILEYWKLPKNTKAQPWRTVLEEENIDANFEGLLDGLFEYDSTRRFSALQALCHPFFDEIRNQKQYQKLKQRYEIEDDLFYFLPNQVPDRFASILAPSWTLETI